MAKEPFTFGADERVLSEIRALFSDPATAKKISDIVGSEKYKLSEDAQRTVLGVIRDAVVGKITDVDVAPRIIDVTEMDFVDALDLQSDVFDGVLEGIVDALATQVEVYRDLHPEEFLPPSPPVLDAHEQLAIKVARESGFAPADPVLAKRLENIIVSRLREVRADADTLAVLEKPAKTGGMAFSAEQSAKVLAAIAAALPELQAKKADVEKARADYDARKKSAMDAKAKREQELASRESTPEAAPKIKKDDYAAEAEKADVKEIENAGAQVPGKVDLKEVQENRSEIDRAVDEAVAKSGVAPAEDNLRTRYHNLVSMYLRDLRDDFETRAKLASPVANGGMGLAPQELERVMGVLSSTKAAFGSVAMEKAEEGRKLFVEQGAKKQLTGADDEEKKQQASADRAYQDLMVRGGGKIPPPAPALSPQPRVIPVVSLDKPAAVPPPPPAPPKKPAPSSQPASAASVPARMPMVKPQPIPAPPSPVALPRPQSAMQATPVAPSPQPPSPRQKPAAPPAPPKNLPIAPPPIPPAAVVGGVPSAKIATRIPSAGESSPSRPMSSMASAKPVVTDVKPSATKLFGPVEELRAVGIKEFRQFSRDPREATMKIKDKIDLLADQSFEKKTEGIKAWQASDANRAYLDVLRESLQGTPVPDVIAGREAKGEQTLSKAEFDAIMALNRQLRFG